MVCDQLADLTKILEAEGELSVVWLSKNEMIVNSAKFQAIIQNKKEVKKATHKLIVDKKEIKTTNSIKLQGISIDDKLKFNEHISVPCSKAAMQLNTFRRLQKYMKNQKKKQLLTVSFSQTLIIVL